MHPHFTKVSVFFSDLRHNPIHFLRQYIARIKAVPAHKNRRFDQLNPIFAGQDNPDWNMTTAFIPRVIAENKIPIVIVNGFSNKLFFI